MSVDISEDELLKLLQDKVVGQTIVHVRVDTDGVTMLLLNDVIVSMPCETLIISAPRQEEDHGPN